MECHKDCVSSSSTTSLSQLNDSTVIPIPNEEAEDTTAAAEKEDDTKSLSVPCVVCFVPVADKVADKSKIFEPLTQDEKEDDKLFQWFLLNFWIHFKKKDKSQVKSKLERFDELTEFKSVGWDGEGGTSPPVPFCEECKMELMGLMEMKNTLMNGLIKRKTSVRRYLTSGMQRVRRKMARCEPDYVNSGIYEEDRRYYRVRKCICLHPMHVNGARAWNPGRIQTEIEPGENFEGEEETEATEVPSQRKMRRMVVEVPPPPQMEMRGRVLEVPCLICCETLKTFPDEKKTMARKAEDNKVFRWFLNHLQNPKGQLMFSFGGKAEVTTECWDGQRGRSEPLEFCGGCRDGILEWIDVRNSQKMYKARAKEIRMMKGRMRGCEDEFEKSGIYEKDWRYFNVRRKVVKVLETEELPVKPKPVLQKNKGKMRRKGSKKKLVFERTEMDKILGEGFGNLGEQRVEIVVKTEEKDEKTGEIWPWEDDEDGKAPIIHVKVEQDDAGVDLLGSGTGFMEIETGNYERIQVKQEIEEMDCFEPDAGALDIENDDFDESQEQSNMNCLLCYKAISKEKDALAPVLTNDLNEQNFNSMFVLQKMLNVPKEKLAGYLEHFGNPGKWVEYCVTCLCLVDRALLIQKEINKLEDKLKEYQEKMKLRIQATSKKEDGILRKPAITRITEESRQFVISSLETKQNKNQILSSSTPSPPDNPEEIIPIPSSAKKAKLSCNEDKKDLELDRNKDTNIKILSTGNYKCSQCPTLNTPMSLIQFYSHLIFHAQRPFKCSICHIYWSSPAELEKNPFVKDNPSNNEHVCCEATLMKIPEDEKFNPGKIWSCKWCPDKKFEMEMERDLHENNEHSILKSQLLMKYNCLSCSKAYQSYGEWLLHRVLEHPKIAATSCLYCDFTEAIQTKEEVDVLDTVQMRSHVNLKHSSRESYFTFPETCDFSGMAVEFGKFQDFLIHMRNFHKGLRPYQCEICKKSLAVKNYLYSHMALSHRNNVEAALTNLIGTTKGSCGIIKISTSVSAMPSASPSPQPTDLPPTQPASASTRNNASLQNNEDDDKAMDQYYIQF